MAKRTGPTNPITKKLIADLRTLSTKEKSKIWDRVADDLLKPSRTRRKVNIYSINKCADEGETALVPGKVLSDGNLTKKITVAAFQFSEKAREKINKTGKAISLRDLMKDNPNGKKIRIIG